MTTQTAFDAYASEYDHWFDEKEPIYQAEIAAMKRFIPTAGSGIEIGVGTGRFASQFGIKIGIDPSRNMLNMARQRGLAVCQGAGEFLPFRDAQFDFALLVTVVCFVENLAPFFLEVRRVIKADGMIIVGFIDKNSDLGKLYESRKATDKFYKEAHFYSVGEITDFLRQTGFVDFQYN
ncbi:MAG: class I SAM-dependent methyltransferase [Anaerolineales bacterium]|nr:class I SAM-dependent methyltransferase [Anaerolineales bacterium]